MQTPSEVRQFERGRNVVFFFLTVETFVDFNKGFPLYMTLRKRRIIAEISFLRR